MADRAQAEELVFGPTVFEGRHHGFPDATHKRRIELQPDGLRILDTVSSSVEHDLEWTFPIAPGAERLFELRAEGLDFRAEPGRYSPSYGIEEPMAFLRARRRSRPGDDVTEIRIKVRV
jgi:hypothetical protein